MRGAGNSGEQLTAIFSDGGGMRGEPGSAAAIRPLPGRAKRGLRAGAAVAAAIPGDDLQGGAAVRGERRAKPWGLRPRVAVGRGTVARTCCSSGGRGGHARDFRRGRATAGNAACRRRRAKLRFRHDEGRYGIRKSCGTGAGVSFLRPCLQKEPGPAAGGREGPSPAPRSRHRGAFGPCPASRPGSRVFAPADAAQGSLS